MTTVSEVLTRSVLQVFNEADADRRAELVAATYSPDVVFHDPEGTVTGRDAFAARIAELLAGTGGLPFTLRRPVQESVGLGVASWSLGPEGQPPVATGTDVARRGRPHHDDVDTAGRLTGSNPGMGGPRRDLARQAVPGPRAVLPGTRVGRRRVGRTRRGEHSWRSPPSCWAS